MAGPILAIGSMAKCMDWVSITGKINDHLRVSIIWTVSKDLVYISSKMELCIKATGKMESSMVLD